MLVNPGRIATMHTRLLILAWLAPVLALQAPPRKKVVVVGAGWAGLSTAWTLSKNNVDVTLVDAAARPGGVVRDGFTTRGGRPAAITAPGCLLPELIGADRTRAAFCGSMRAPGRCLARRRRRVGPVRVGAGWTNARPQRASALAVGATRAWDSMDGCLRRRGVRRRF